MLGKKKNKLFIPAGFISLFLLFPLCYWHIQKEIKQNTQYTLEATSLEANPDFSNDITRLFLAVPHRNYSVFQLTEDHLQNKKTLLEYCQRILKFDWKKDTINGIQINLNSSTQYKDFVAILEIIHSTKIKHYIHQENSFWLLVPNTREFSAFQQRVRNFEEENGDITYSVCGRGLYNHYFDTAYQKQTFLDKLLLFYQNIANSTPPTKYLLLILILAIWNVFHLIKIPKNNI